MDSNAPGQLLGYALQFPRALYHLLLCGPGDAVCVEVLGDVATLHASGTVTAEEDKSSIQANPVSNKSVDLWKTLANWISGINAGTYDIDKTIFILYTNKKGRKAIVDQFHEATTLEAANAAISSAKDTLSKLKDTHEVWQHYSFVMNNEDVLKKLITRFELQVIDKGTGVDECKSELIKKFVPTTQTEFVLENLLGWLYTEVSSKISAQQPAIIMWDSFKSKFAPLFEKIQIRSLIDFTLQPDKDDVRKVALKRPLYVRQLDLIGIDDIEIMSAVADYLRAKANRGKWIEEDIIDEQTASEFEERLIRFWDAQTKSLKITERHRTIEERAQLLFLACKCRQETIKDMTPPPFTVAGTYHSLAEAPMIGWHEEWESQFKG